jgi:hypothetical protein
MKRGREGGRKRGRGRGRTIATFSKQDSFTQQDIRKFPVL